jgi:hypothetical protein
MRRIAVVLSVVLALVIAGEAQVSNTRASRTVTNTDLDRFKQTRLAAERDYRENYAQMGFPSPEELDRQNEQSRAEREELSAKLREERLERERISAERARAEAELAAAEGTLIQSATNDGYSPFYGYGYYGGYGSYYGGFGRSFGRRHFGPGGFIRFGRNSRTLLPYFAIPGYRATPAGVFDAPLRVPVFSGRGGIRRR